jgi:hypothetical protein
VLEEADIRGLWAHFELLDVTWYARCVAGEATTV